MCYLNYSLISSQNHKVLRKIDKHILIILTLAYFWQIFDKAVWGYGNVFGSLPNFIVPD